MSSSIPQEEGIDHTLNLLREGYMYIFNRRRSFNSDIFETRLLGRKAICMGGKEAAEIFYDQGKFKREGAAPNRLKQTLFGKTGIQTTDADIHRHRKEMFMTFMNFYNLNQLKAIVKEQWEVAVEKWEQKKRITFYEEIKELLCRTACQWAGVLVKENDIRNLTNDLEAMYISPAAIGPTHWKGRSARNRVEKWIASLVDKVRSGELHPPVNTALYQFAIHHDLDNNLLDRQTVSVEIVNILRPIVAISIYINFSILALHHYSEEKKKLLSDGNYVHMFIQEVRRFYPFFPFLAARAKKDFFWKNYKFEKNTLTLLDLYGTNHDPNIWDNPERFDPQRFLTREEHPFEFIPQGGGEYLQGHRCAGEQVTVEVMKESINYLLTKMDYDIPEQDLSYSMVNIPSIPHSKIILENIRKK